MSLLEFPFQIPVLQHSKESKPEKQIPKFINAASSQRK